MGSGAMFDAIADRYDLLNRINSLGLDRRWRRLTVNSLHIEARHRCLDLATGTGDMVLAIDEAQPGVSCVGLDPSARMLDVARRKLARAGVGARLVEGDAQALPFEDGSFDRATMAFGIRNIPDRGKALSELARVLAPGGRAAILELAEPEGRLARFHVHAVVPRIGALLSMKAEYDYLPASIAAFPKPEAFAQTMTSAGLPVRRIERLAFGACALFVAGVDKGSAA